MAVKLNKRETALVLAGLRLLQRTEVPPVGVFDILVDGDADEFKLEDIDRLCEKVNA